MWSIQQISENEWQVLHDGDVVELPTGNMTVERYEEALAYIAGQLAEAPAVTEATSVDGLLAETWEDDEGIFFSEPTGDGRDFTNCVWTWRDPAAVPVPLMLQTCTEIGHFGAQLAGFVERISRDESGTGHSGGRFYDTDVGRQFRDMLLGDRRFGVSVDPGAVDATFECIEEDEDGWCLEERIDFLAYQVIGITGTPFAGFERAKIKLSGGAAVTAAATAFADLPLGERDVAWAADAAVERVRTFASSDGSGEPNTIDWASYGQAFLWFDDQNVEEFGSYKLPIADVVDGALRANWNAVTAAADAVDGSDIPEGDLDAVRAHIDSYFAKAAEQYDDDEISPPWEQQSALAEDDEDAPDSSMMPMITDHEFEDGNDDGFCDFCVNAQGDECVQQCGGAESVHGEEASDEEGEEGEDMGSGVAAAARVPLSIPLNPSRAWMTLPEPQLGDQGGHDIYGAAVSELLVEQPDGSVAVPWQILDNGLVFGHIARWGQPHVGYPGRRVTAPDSETAYAHFNVGQIVCDDGSSVAAGTMVVGCEHAPLRGISPFEARDFYAHSGFGWCNVHVSSGQYGVWGCGVLRPDVTPEQVRVLRSLSPSGDWRKIGRSPELIGALMVNVPGFPIAREAITASGFEPSEPVHVAGVIEGGETTALVAAGMVYRCSECAKRARELARQQEPESLPQMINSRLDRLEARLDARLGLIERRTQHLLSPGREDLRRRILGNGHTAEPVG